MGGSTILEQEKLVVTAGATRSTSNNTSNHSEGISGWSSRRVVVNTMKGGQSEKISELNKRLRGVVRFGSSSASR
jgi:hypothetical protein